MSEESADFAEQTHETRFSSKMEEKMKQSEEKTERNNDECRLKYSMGAFLPGAFDKVNFLGFYPFLMFGKFIPVFDYTLDIVSAGKLFIFIINVMY